jgi:hypothetical protein
MDVPLVYIDVPLVYMDVPLVFIDVPLVYMDVPFSFTSNNKGKIRRETRPHPHPRTNKSEELRRFFF